jgi:outer membrane protein TolC
MRASAQAELMRAQADVETQRLRLATDFPQIAVPDRAPDLPDPALLEGTSASWVERIVAGSHEIGIYTETAAQHDAMARRASADRLPDPTIGVRTFSEFSGIEKGWGLVFSMPIGVTRRDADARSQQAAADAARSQVDATRRDITREAQLTLANANLSFKLWKAARAARVAHATSLARQRRAYELGEISLTERLQAERLDAEAALVELRTRVDAHEALLRVKVDGHEMWDWDEK